jgi:hypothetical protein
MNRGSVEKLPELKPQVVEIPRKGFRELYLLDDTWSAGVFLLIGISSKQFGEWLKERFNLAGETLDETKSGTATWVKYDGASYDIVTMSEKWTWARIDWCTLVHELHHVTSNILKRKGLTHSDATEECWAYLQDSLLHRFIWALRNRHKVRQRPKTTQKRPLAKKRQRR